MSVSQLVSFQLPDFVGFIASQLWIEIIAFAASSSEVNSTYLALFGDSAMIVTTRLKSGQLTNPSQCSAEQSQSQTQRMSSWHQQSSQTFHITGIVRIVIIVMSLIVVVISVPRGAVEEEGRWMYLADSCWICLSVWTVSEAAEGLVGSVSQWVMVRTGGPRCHESHLRVGHWGLGGRVSVSGGGRVGPIFWWRLTIDGRLVQRLLG